MPLELDAAAVQRGEALWTWDGTVSSALLGRFPVRMTVAGYPQPHGKLGLVVVSPIEPTEAVVSWLRETGDVNFVVAPNKAHWWWAEPMKAAFPASLLVAPAGLKAKRPELPVDVRVTAAGVQDLPGSWPADVIDAIVIQGLSVLDELALLHKTSSTLILTDAAFNFDRAWVAARRVGAPVRLYLAAAGGHRRCCLTQPFSYLIDSPGAVKASFDHMLAAWEWDKVSMAHGEFIAAGGKDAFVRGSVAFVNRLAEARREAAAGGAGAGVATAAALLAAAAVIGGGVAVGVSGIVAARKR